MSMAQNKKDLIWIDLDNSPHVPFFSPIIKELGKHGYGVAITARDCFQVCGLADLYHFKYKRIGRHYGKNKLFKVAGTLYRSFQLLPAVLKNRPAVAVSHGSRSQLIACWLLGIPSITLFDYEHTQGLVLINPTWMVAPEVIAEKLNGGPNGKILSYPGLKEDVYVIEFLPDANFGQNVGIQEDDLLVTIRPPATEAHYHNPEAEKLYVEVVDYVGSHPDTRMVILPRNEVTQKDFIRKTWPKWCESRKIIVPEKVVNGLDLVWASDLVVSGGGTMNREAAALGVPVYTIFRGKKGAVDQDLAEQGRLVFIEKVGDIREKIKLEKREKPDRFTPANRVALDRIVDIIIKKS